MRCYAGDGAGAARRGRRDGGAQHRFRAALEELASLFHRIAVAQVVPGRSRAIDDAERVVGVRGQHVARERAARLPDLCAGSRRSRARAGRGDRLCDDAAALAGVRSPRAALASRRRRGPEPASRKRGTRALATPSTAEGTLPADTAEGATRAALRASTADSCNPEPALPADAAGWPAFVAGLKLAGMAAQLAAQTELKAISRQCPHAGAAGCAPASRRQGLRRQAQGGARAGDRPQAAARVRGRVDRARRRSPRRSGASAPSRSRRPRREFRDEPFVRDVLERFDAKIRPDSIKPVS